MQVSVVRPALLALAGPITPFLIAWSLVTNTLGEKEGGVLFIAGLIYGGLGLLLLAFALAELFDERNRRLLGSIVAALNSIAGFFTVAVFGGAFLYDQPSVSVVLRFLAYLVAPTAGFLGGVLGVFWKTQWRAAAKVPGLAGAARMVLVGGSVSLVLFLPIAMIAWLLAGLFLLAPMLVLVCGILLYKNKWNHRALGAIIIASGMAAWLPLAPNLELAFFGGPFSIYAAWSLLSLVGTAVAIMGGVQSIRWKQP